MSGLIAVLLAIVLATFVVPNDWARDEVRKEEDEETKTPQWIIRPVALAEVSKIRNELEHVSL
jgi:hypothetical protein